MRRRTLALTLAALLFSGSAAFAVNPDEVLKDPALEARARQISTELRCLVCQNQSIDISDADLAKDLRVIVRERLTAGDTDAQVMDYVVARYGEFVLLKPRFSGANAVLWLAPLVLVLGGGMVLLGYMRRTKPRNALAALSKEEQEKLADIVADDPARPAEEARL
jgi:cytochrome c-type biogenesis protein CcmH